MNKYKINKDKFVKEVYDNNIKIHIETEFQQESYLDIGNQLEYSMVFIYVIILVGVCVIIITTSNIINDESNPILSINLLSIFTHIE